jgi:hypothetical protein
VNGSYLAALVDKAVLHLHRLLPLGVEAPPVDVEAFLREQGCTERAELDAALRLLVTEGFGIPVPQPDGEVRYWLSLHGADYAEYFLLGRG